MPNPILQGIRLHGNLRALQDLSEASRLADPDRKDPLLDPIRATLDQQIRRVDHELAALVSLYGGPDAG